MRKYYMKKSLVILAIALLLSFVLTACGQKATEALPTATLSNDQLGTRAAQTAYVKYTEVPPVQPSATQVKNTPKPTNTETPLPPTATHGSTAIPTSDIFNSGQTTFRDDFESLSGWYTGSGDSFLVEFSEGGYRMVVDMVTGADPVYSIRKYAFEDVIVSVDVMKYKGKDGSYFGVVCRYADPANYYRFVVYTQGEYEIAKKIGGVFTSLVRSNLEKPLKADGTPNNIRALCSGNTLQLYVNDSLAAEVSDQALTTGYTGLIAGTDLEAGLDVLFDNFVITQP
jgi:hypothetical protein